MHISPLDAIAYIGLLACFITVIAGAAGYEIGHSAATRELLREMEKIGHTSMIKRIKEMMS